MLQTFFLLIHRYVSVRAEMIYAVGAGYRPIRGDVPHAPPAVALHREVVESFHPQENAGSVTDNSVHQPLCTHNRKQDTVVIVNGQYNPTTGLNIHTTQFTQGIYY